MLMGSHTTGRGLTTTAIKWILVLNLAVFTGACSRPAAPTPASPSNWPPASPPGPTDPATLDLETGLRDGLAKLAWVGARDRAAPWEIGVIGGTTYEVAATPDDATARPVWSWVVTAEQTGDGWTIGITSAADGSSRTIATRMLPEANLVLATVSADASRAYVTAAGANGHGAVVEVDVATGAQTIIAKPTLLEGGDVTVFRWSPEGGVLLHSYCSVETCHASVIRPGLEVTTLDEVFPVAITSTHVLAATDPAGERWASIDLETMKSTALNDPTGAIRRPISGALGVDGTRFIVDAGADLIVVDGGSGDLRVVLSSVDREGWALGPAVIDDRWVLLTRAERDTGPRLTQSERQEIGFLDLLSSRILSTVLSVSVAR